MLTKKSENMFSTVGCTAGVFLNTVVILDIIFMLCQFIVNKVLFVYRARHRREIQALVSTYSWPKNIRDILLLLQAMFSH